METVHEETYNGYKIELCPDYDAESPREWDNAGQMLCWHRRYVLGDNNPYSGPEDFEEANAENPDKILVCLPLFLYDHGGITINVGGFSCPWDSGQVGFILIRRSKAIAEWGDIPEPELIQKATDCLKGEVEIYARYLEGDCVGYVVTDPEGERLDSCWGFIGDHKYAIEEAKARIDWEHKSRKEARRIEKLTFAV